MDAEALALLMPVERTKLTLFKWIYALTTAGFSRAEAQHITFFKYRLAKSGWTASDLATREGTCSVLIW